MNPKLLVACALVAASSGALAAPITALPTKRAKDPAAFAPKGWVIEQSVPADLDGNGKADVILVLVQDEKTEGDRDRALVVARARADGFEVIGTNRGLLTFVGGAGVKGGDGAPEIQVNDKGVFSLRQDGGSREFYSSVHRFRYDAKKRRVELIGYDTSNGDSLTGASHSSSCNLLTGACIDVKQAAVDEQTGSQPAAVTTKRKGPKATKRLEEVDRT